MSEVAVETQIDQGITAWNKITGIKATRLAETKNLTHEQWLDVRNRGIGGSDIAAIAGLNPFKSAIDVFLDKTGKIPPVQENAKMKWGKLLEEPVASEFETSTGFQVQKVNAILQSTEMPFALANLDRLYKNTETRQNGILEVKTTGWAQAWEDDQIPDMYYCQAMWYLAVTGLPEARFAVLINGSDFRTPPTLKRDENVIKNLFQIADKFWNHNVLTNTPPDPDRSPATKEAYKLLYPEVEEQTIILNKSLIEELRLYASINEQIKMLEQDKSLIASKVLAAMKTAKWGICENEIKVTRVLKALQTIDKDRLQTEFPEAWKAVVGTKDSIYPLIKKMTAKK